MTLPFSTYLSKQGFQEITKKFSDNYEKGIFRKQLTVLSITLINGRFKALSIINDAIHKGWERPGVIRKPQALRQAIAEAIDNTQFPGTHVSIIVEDHRLMTFMVQLPSMPHADLMRILERKAQQVKNWDGPAVWRHYLGMLARGKQSIHLEVWPQNFIDEIVQMCEELGLYLQQLAPLSALSESQLSSLTVEQGEAAMLISMLDGKVTFVAGGEDGIPLLTRHLAPVQDWIPLGERVGTEVNRTIMFINQQINLPIPQIWFLGEDERLTLEEVQAHVATPMVPCPVSPDWKYWLWVGATLPMNLPTNFTPLHVRRAPMKKMLANTAAAVIAVFLAIGIGATGAIEGNLAKNQERNQRLASQEKALDQEHRHWQRQLVSVQSKRQWAQTLTENTTAMLEGPLLSYLGKVVPPQIILHKASIKKNKNSWNLELAGHTSANLSSTLVLVEKLAQELGDGPYHVSIDENWRDQLLTQSNSPTTDERGQPLYRWALQGNFS